MSATSETAQQTVFLTGATGYIGATFLQQLLDLPHPPKKVTCLARKQDKVDALSSIPSVEGVKGGFDNLGLLTRLVEGHDITVETADSDNPELVNALLEGMRKRKEDGKETIFIHTSGTGTLVDDARGEYAGEVVYTDGKSDPPKLLHINDLPETAFHRKVDLSIAEADAKGWCKSYIILPGTVWGEGTGPLFDKGIANPHSKQIPQQVDASLEVGRPRMIGKGLNVWPHIHIDDVGSHIATVYTAAVSGKAPHGSSGYFMCTAGEYQLLEATRHIGQIMRQRGWSKTADPTPFTEDEVTKFYSMFEEIGGSKYYSGTNSRGISVQAKDLGWGPKHADVEEFYAYCRAETERLGAQKQL